jgi:bifunctional non-homologous end joining protein LigD
MALKVYNEKRDFQNTPEPKGDRGKSSQLRFVVQRHDASRLHYDFRLEMDGVLKSWAVPKGPSLNPNDKRLAVMVEDHPVSYGSFVGEIPKGNYGAGIVQIWDSGTFQPLEKIASKDIDKHFLKQLEKGDLKFELKGKHLKGAFALVRMKSADGDDRNWLLIKKQDDYAAKKYDIESIEPIKPFPKSRKVAAPKSTKATAKKKAKPKTVKSTGTKAAKASNNATLSSATWKKLQKPMLATLSSYIPEDEGWYFEVKYDGYRAVTHIADGKVEMLSRNGNSFNKTYASLVEELKNISDDVVLDGEVVIENKKGLSDFQSLQNYPKTGEGTLKYYVFDILYLNGYRTDEIPLHYRKDLLKTFFEKYSLDNVILTDYVEDGGETFANKLKKAGYEGVIIKRTDSIYLPGKRSDAWLKHKNVKMQEAIICGYTAPQRSRKYFGSLILGMYNDQKELVYIGNCGTGFTDVSLKELHEQLVLLTTEKCPFQNVPSMTGMKGKPTWVKPKLVCMVKFQDWTKDSHLRVPVFEGLRADKSVKEVTKEKTMKATDVKKAAKRAAKKTTTKKAAAKRTTVKSTLNEDEPTLTNLDKVYFPKEGITKGDVIDYYRRIAKYMVPYLKDRPQSLNRHPNGITGMSFYQKDMDVDKIPRWVKTVQIYSKSNDENIDYLICNDERTLLYMANLGCIEINPWHSRIDKPDHPDYLIMDLDPAGKITFKQVVDTALAVKEVCDELKIHCYCKTSGATGIHIYIPLKAQYAYEDIRLFAEYLAIETHKKLPDITSVERSVSKRKNKIYVDFLQNRKGQTIASVYSVRPKPGATVSTPLKWSEVNHKLDPSQFTIFNVEQRVKKVGDIWKPVLGKGINLNAVLKRIK